MTVGPDGAVTIEACVETPAQARAAAAAGADRIELCRDLAVGGLTPSAEAIRATRGAVSVPVFVMVRERPGPFAYTPAEVAAMVDRIGEVRAAGADGIVCGAVTEGGGVDLPATRRLVSAARPGAVTFHRAFDEVPDPSSALEALVSLGIERVLTAGGRGPASAHLGTLARLVVQAAGRIRVMAGGSVRPGNVLALVRHTGVAEVHARMDDDPARARALRAALTAPGAPRSR